jgi:hypothetical protein
MFLRSAETGVRLSFPRRDVAAGQGSAGVARHPVSSSSISVQPCGSSPGAGSGGGGATSITGGGEGGGVGGRPRGVAALRIRRHTRACWRGRGA